MDSVKFRNVCRVCLKTISANINSPDLFTYAFKTKNLETKTEIKSSLVDFLERITGIKVKQLKNISGKICTKCIETFERAFNLLEIFKANQQILLECSSESTQSPEIVECYPDVIVKTENTVITNIKLEEEEITAERTDSEEQFDPVEDSYEESEEPTSKKTKKIYKCHVCFRELSSKGSLDGHLLTHTGEKPFLCEICGRRFTLRADYRNHYQDHSKIRKKLCSVCGKSLRVGRDFARHMRIHTGERPYKCSICPKAFVASNTLKRHSLVHTGEKPYECKHCNKKFNQSSSYRRHLKNHK